MPACVSRCEEQDQELSTEVAKRKTTFTITRIWSAYAVSVPWELSSSLLTLYGKQESHLPAASYGVDEALAYGVEDGLGPVVDVELPVDVGDVVSDGLLGDVEGSGYLLVAVAAGEGGDDLQLAAGEPWNVRLLKGTQEA